MVKIIQKSVVMSLATFVSLSLVINTNVFAREKYYGNGVYCNSKTCRVD